MESRIPQKVRSVLDRYELKALEFEPGSTPTSQMAADRIGVELGQIAKSILMKGKDQRFYLVVCSGDCKIDNHKLKAKLGVKARMATPEETFERTGFRPGGVCPFGIKEADGEEGVQILLDESLCRFEAIFPAAGNDSSGVRMTFKRLEEVTRGWLADVTKLKDPVSQAESNFKEPTLRSPDRDE